VHVKRPDFAPWSERHPRQQVCKPDYVKYSSEEDLWRTTGLIPAEFTGFAGESGCSSLLSVGAPHDPDVVTSMAVHHAHKAMPTRLESTHP
jgi:hypothetical protein